MNQLRLSSLIALITLVAVLPACTSPKFANDWQAALQAPQDGIEGAWEGDWKSETSGHHGKLRCLVTKSPADSHTYNFNYWASWATVLSGGFQVTYDVQPSKDGYTVTGESDLGPFGLFHHQGHINDDHFHADYRSKNDQGTFEMSRPH
ncbi:MAG: hypothetical protein AAF591_08240 [Verrucomicrobiota bacterium]